MPYPTAEDLRLRLRLPEPFSAAEEATADLLIDLAAGAIEEEAGQALLESTDTVVLDGNGTARLVLPRWPVTAIASVTEDGDLLVPGRDQDYTWSAAGILHRRGRRCWPCEEQILEVEYTAGHNPVPAGLRRIVLRLAAGAWGNPGSLSSETLGDHARSWASAADAGMELSEADKRTVSAYRART